MADRFIYLPQAGTPKVLTKEEMQSSPSSGTDPLLAYIEHSVPGDFYQVPGGAYVGLGQDYTP